MPGLVLRRLRSRLIVAAACTLFLWSAARPACGNLALSLDFSPAFGPGEQAAIEAGADIWRGLILGYQPGVAATGLVINIQMGDLGGPGGALAFAAPSSTIISGGYDVPTAAMITFDVNDLGTIAANGWLDDLALHEIAHCLGFGILWQINNLAIPGTGQYIGAHALDAYRAEYDDAATFIPVELDGGPGSADYHWDDVQGIVDRNGRPLAFEIMTGVLSSNSYVSATTLESLHDLGYDVVDLLTTGVAGDVNQDAVLNGQDIAAFQVGWFADTAGFNSVAQITHGDLNHSGLADLDDWFALRQAFHGPLVAAAPPEVALPEPAAGVLAALGGVGILWRRRSA